MSQQINLFNPIFLKQKKHFSAVTMLQGLGAILLGSIVFVVYAQWQVSALQVQTAATEKQLKATKAQLEKVTAQYAPKQKNTELEEDIKRMELELKARLQAFNIVQKGGAGSGKGHAEYMRAFSRQIVNGLWLTGFTIEENDIELKGRALQPELVPVFINRLKQEQVMQGKSFARLSIDTPEVEPANGEDAAGASGTSAVAASASVSASAAKRRNAPVFVEFVLRSTEIVPEQAGAAGIGAPDGLPRDLSGALGGLMK